MRKSFRIYERLISTMLICIMVLGIFYRNGLIVYANPEYKEFQIGVFSDVYGWFIGDFLACDGDIYVEVNTLMKMGKFICDNPESDSPIFKRSEETFFEPDSEEIIITESGRYIAFVDCVVELGLSTAFQLDDKTMLVKANPDIPPLVESMEQYYKDPGYSMEYVTNAKRFGLHRATAVAADVIKNFKYISFLSGRMETEQYEEAFWNILLPEDDSDIAVGKEALKNAEYFTDYVKAADESLEGLFGDKGGCFGKIGTAVNAFGDAKDKYRLELVLNISAQMRGMGEAEESCVRGLEYITKTKANKNDKMKAAGKLVLDEYSSETPIWMAGMRDIVGENLDENEEEWIKSALPHSYLCDLTNAAVNLAFKTQAQVDASLLAFSCLDIQEQCESRYIYCMKKYRNATEWKDKLQYLQKAHDLSVVYLEAGREAYAAAAIDNDLEKTFQGMSERIDEQIEFLADYQSSCFTVFEQALETQNRLLNEANHFTEQEVAELTEQMCREVVVTITYNPIVNWTPVTIGCIVQGSSPNGDELTYSEEDNCFYTSGGTKAATIEQSTGKTEIRTMDPNVEYTFEIDNGEAFVVNNITMEDMNLEIHITNTLGMDYCITEDINSKHMYRSYTGVWLYAFRIRQGEVETYNPFEGIEWPSELDIG